MPRQALLIANGKNGSGKTALSKVVEGLGRLDIDPIHEECDSREQLSSMIVKEGLRRISRPVLQSLSRSELPRGLGPFLEIRK
jgi:ABC-type transport system involved in cytochrome c biogenesis ATPase subunit